MPPEIARRIAAGLELRRRGKLSPTQDAALSELERRYSQAAPAAEGDDGWRDVPPPAESVLAQQAGFGGTGVGEEAGRSFGGPREAGQDFAAKSGGAVASLQGASNMLGGVLTPIGAAQEYVRSRVGGKPRSWDDSMEFSRGQREGAAEEYPAEYVAGNVAGLYGGVKAASAVFSKAPPLVRSVFQLQTNQTKRNIARMAATGAAVSGVTAGMQEGTDAALGAAGWGGAAGLAIGGTIGSAVGLGRAVSARVSPTEFMGHAGQPVRNAAKKAINAVTRISADHAAIRALAKKYKESNANIARLYNEFVERTGRRPGLNEIVSEVEAGRVGQMGAQFSRAGRVLREGEEAAANVRPVEVQRVVERGGRTTTIPEQLEEVNAVVREAQSLRRPHSFGGRVTSTARAQIERRNNVMDAFMERYGEHRVHATEAMKDILERQDVQELMPPILRRRINEAIQNGMDFGTIDIPLNLWDKIRKYAGTKAKTEPLYREYRDRVRDYVRERIPEYGEALTEFGRRSTGAKATTLAERGVKGATQEFADMLRIAGSKPHAVTTMTSSQAGVRKWLGDQMHERPRQILERLGRDSKLRTNLRTILSQDEMVRLESLGEQYGLRVNILAGVKAGRKGLTDDGATFADAMRTARDVPGKEAAVRGGLRGALAAKGGEDAASAVGTARALTSPGLQDRLTTAFGAPEAARLGQAGALITQAGRNLRAATPGATQAQQEAAEAAEKVYHIIAGGVMATGTSSGALKAHWAKRAVSRLNLGEKAATRLAEYATDPRRAPEAIRRLHASGISSAELLEWYQNAAIAAGITTGAAVE